MNEGGILKRIDEKKISAISLSILIMYVSLKFLQTTMFPISKDTLKELSYALSMVIFVLGIINLVKNAKEQRKILIFCIIPVVVGIIGSFRSEDLYLDYAYVVFGTIGLHYRKVLKGYVISISILLALTVTASLTGVIENLVYSNGFTFRDSFGIVYTTDFTSYFFYLILFFWIAWNKLPHYITLIIDVIVFFISKFTDSDTCMICSLAFFALIIGSMFFERVTIKGRFFNVIRKTFDWLLILVFPLLTCMLFAMVFIYSKNTGMGDTLNRWLSGRLGLTLKSLKENGISVFGTAITQIGNGASTFPAPTEYNFVDSTYPLLLIRYGIVFYLVVCLSWVKTVWIAVKGKNYRLALGMALIALHSVSEHHFVEANYNILLFIPFAYYEIRNDLVQKEASYRKKNLVGFVSVSAIFALVAATARIWFEYLRTVYKWLDKESILGVLVFVCLFVLLYSIILMLIKTLYNIGMWLVIKRVNKSDYKLDSKSDNKSDNESDNKSENMLGYNGFRWRYSIISVILIILFCLLNVFLIKKADISTVDEREKDNKILKLVFSNSKGEVYSDKYPVLYKKDYSDLSYSVLTGEDLARYDNCTVLVDREQEYNVFFRAGFIYAPISEYSALYTNDDNVIESLMSKGIRSNSFFNEIRYCGVDPVMPEMDLRANEYEVNLEAQIKDMSANGGDDLTVTQNLLGYIYVNYTDLIERNRVIPIRYETVSDEGKINMKGRFRLTKDTRNVKISLGSKIPLRIDKFSLQANPEYDIHKGYDKENRLVFEKYYSADGKLVVNRMNYSVCEYEYDEDGNRVSVKYYNESGVATNYIKGYHECRFAYNDDGKVYREEYYDAGGDRAILSEGYSIMEMVYDKNGNIYMRKYYDTEGKLLFVRVPGACIGW